MLFKKQATKREVYIVKTPFKLVEWGDMLGESEAYKIIDKNSQIDLEVYSNGRIKRIWVEGVEFGKYKLETTKAEIITHSEKVF